MQLSENAVPDIVVIDDDPLICNLIVEVLDDCGAAVQYATTGRSGRRLLTGKHFDLAIIDVVLSDASGIALAAIAANENTPVLLITGRQNVAARLQQYNLANHPCLLKPFSVAQLRAEAERVMRESRQNVQRIKQGMAQWQASFIAFEDLRADTEQVIAVSRRLCGQGNGAEPDCE